MIHEKNLKQKSRDTFPLRNEPSVKEKVSITMGPFFSPKKSMLQGKAMNSSHKPTTENGKGGGYVWYQSIYTLKYSTLQRFITFFKEPLTPTL
jgi:hypothetical protein